MFATMNLETFFDTIIASGGGPALAAILQPCESVPMPNKDRSLSSAAPPPSPDKKSGKKAGKASNWNQFRECFEQSWNCVPIEASPEGIDSQVDKLHQCIDKSLDRACPLSRTVYTPKSVSWWSDNLTNLRHEARLLYNRVRAKKAKWEDYTMARNKYNSALRNAKEGAWRGFCSNISGTHPAARVFKLLGTGARRTPLNITHSDGSEISETDEVLEYLLNHHFPQGARYPPPSSTIH